MSQSCLDYASRKRSPKQVCSEVGANPLNKPLPVWCIYPLDILCPLRHDVFGDKVKFLWGGHIDLAT